jgi:hypothetical protein
MVRLAGSTLVNTCPNLAGTQQQTNSTLSADHLSSSAALSWASNVRGEARVITQLQPQFTATMTATRDDFFMLYDCCVACGILASVGLRHSAGLQEIYISCSLPMPNIASIAPAVKRRTIGVTRMQVLQQLVHLLCQLLILCLFSLLLYW